MNPRPPISRPRKWPRPENCTQPKTWGGTTSVDLTTAIGNTETAYTNAAGRTASFAATTNVGAGVFILKVAGTLDMAAAKNVILAGGALSKNIFWHVSGAVTIGAGTHFKEIVLGQTSFTFGNLSSINGRLLAQTAIVLDATTVVVP